MSGEATAEISKDRGRTGLAAMILASVAVLLAAGAFAISLLHAGPTGPRGAQGARGLQGAAGSTANVVAIQRCIPELTAWINAFNVRTTSNSSGGTYWLTDAYLDTSAQQVSAGCKKVLGLK
jgi:hypothetical protein